MKPGILDTSFILTCVRQKIDFKEELKFLGIKPLLPEQVFLEIKGIAKSKDEAKTALKIIDSFEKIDLKTKNTDKGIIDYANKNPEIIIAALDREIKNKTKNSKLVIRGKKKLEII